MEEMVRVLAFQSAIATEGIAVLIIIFGVLQGAFFTLITSFSRASDSLSVSMRLKLGRWLSVALELLLAADILRTAVAPTWNDIGQLSAIVILRTALNYFLEREIRTESKSNKRILTGQS